MKKVNPEPEKNCNDSKNTGFFAGVYEYVKTVPAGKVTTYGKIAKALGRPRASQLVGFALHSNPDQSNIACHRVVNRYGGLAPSFAFGGSEVQRMLLENEGITFIGELVDMSKHLHETE